MRDVRGERWRRALRTTESQSTASAWLGVSCTKSSGQAATWSGELARWRRGGGGQWTVQREVVVHLANGSEDSPLVEDASTVEVQRRSLNCTHSLTLSSHSTGPIPACRPRRRRGDGGKGARTGSRTSTCSTPPSSSSSAMSLPPHPPLPPSLPCRLPSPLLLAPTPLRLLSGRAEPAVRAGGRSAPAFPPHPSRSRRSPFPPPSLALPRSPAPPPSPLPLTAAAQVRSRPAVPPARDLPL